MDHAGARSGFQSRRVLPFVGERGRGARGRLARAGGAPVRSRPAPPERTVGRAAGVSARAAVSGLTCGDRGRRGCARGGRALRHPRKIGPSSGRIEALTRGSLRMECIFLARALANGRGGAAAAHRVDDGAAGAPCTFSRSASLRQEWAVGRAVRAPRRGGPRQGGGRWRRAGHSENAPSQQCGQTGITGCLADLVIVPPPLLGSGARARRCRGRGAHRKACHGPRLLIGQGAHLGSKEGGGRAERRARGEAEGGVARRLGLGAVPAATDRGRFLDRAKQRVCRPRRGPLGRSVCRSFSTRTHKPDARGRAARAHASAPRAGHGQGRFEASAIISSARGVGGGRAGGRGGGASLSPER